MGRKLVTLALVAVLGLLIWASPRDQTLGDVVKVIYLHGALVRVGEMAFILAGVFGVTFLATGRPAAWAWSWAIQRTALLLWLGYYLSSLATMSLAWGGINWVEPKFVAASQTLALAAVAFAVAYVLERPRLTALINVAVGLLVVARVSLAPPVFHPANAIGESGFMVQGYYYLIALVVAALALQLARFLKAS